MIAKLLNDVMLKSKKDVMRRGVPFRILADTTSGWLVEFPGGAQEYIRGSNIYALEPEETLAHLSNVTGVNRDTLLKAVQTGRLIARRSGSTWLSTVTAVNYLYDGRAK